MQNIDSVSGVKKLEQFLREKGYKFTPERQVVVREVFSSHGHFDAEELYRRIKRRNKKVSLATIYRTLPLLVKSGLIREVMRCQGKGVYEHIWGHSHHDHLICVSCGKVIEFSEDRIEKLQDDICARFQFQPVEHRLGIRGYCKDCQKR